MTQHPEAFIAITGDFNHVSLSSCLTGFVQYVDCPTRGERTLDLFFANLKEAYRTVPLPPLGRSDHSIVYLQGEIETVQICKYLGVVLDNNLEWSANTEAVYSRGQSRLFFLRRLRLFNVCTDMICMFYHTIIESALFYAVVCWGSCTADKNCMRLHVLLDNSMLSWNYAGQ